ncbi:molybdopterin-dependent oxidoreductase [Chloroflexota bacterium]
MVDKTRVIKSTCGFCHAGCGVLIHMEDDKPVRIEGDPDHPANKGALCPIGKATLEHLDHPDRLTYPMKRVGAKGEGKWQRISWDEALDEIATEFNKVKERYGAESVAFVQGCFKGFGDALLARLANAFGSPNTASMSYICFHARLRANIATYGFMSRPDLNHPPACILLWGVNSYLTAFPVGNEIFRAHARGSKLLVVDPMETIFTNKAEHWIAPKPGSDLALALGMIHVIIEENLYDHDFIEKWTVGFNELKSFVKDYNPERVAELTWVPSSEIVNIARFYANAKPACIICGNGMENNVNNYQFNRAAAILRAITGNIGRPGGEMQFVDPSVVPMNSLDIHRYDLIPMDLRRRRIGAEENVLPNYFSALPQKLVKAMLTSKPYPLRAAFVQGGSLLHTYSNAKEALEGLKSLDFMVLTDFFMIPTAEIADIVLPSATYLETDDVRTSGDTPVASVVQKAAQVGERWSDYKILIELAKRLGLGEHFWNDEYELLDFILKPAGISFNEFRDIGVLSGKSLYFGYEKDGFKTPSGKVELYSKQLEEWGFDPLPVYQDAVESRYANLGSPPEYPLIFTSSKLAPFIHSRGRQIKSLRSINPDPTVRINAETASKMGINDGDWVYVENTLGKVKQKAMLMSTIHPQVVIADFGWWFPENENKLTGWDESNLNVITDSNPPYARELGSVTLKAVPCKISKA